MSPTSKSSVDVATAIYLGRRDNQEDCVIADFPSGECMGLGILADGMGGHSAGDIASAIVVGRIVTELKMRRARIAKSEERLPGVLRTAVDEANASMLEYMRENADTRGMGSTVVATVLVGRTLYWASVGDSPLYLLRGGQLRRLNEDHSMAPRIDAMVASGQLSAEVGASHPDRNALTSAISGQKIPRVDCPESGFDLEEGDIVVAASDGLQVLDDDDIRDLVKGNRTKSSAEISNILIEAVRDMNKKDQDNTSVMILKIAAPAAQTTERKASAPAAPAPKVEAGEEKREKVTFKEMDDKDAALIAAVSSDIEKASDLLNEALSL